MLNNLSGIGDLQAALATTNTLLADVLAELKQTNAELRETNSERLEAIAAELRVVNENLPTESSTGSPSTGARGGS